MSSVSERLLQRLRAEGVEVPDGSTLHRTFATGSTRRVGAWSWFALAPDGSELKLGSQHSMGELLALPVWEITTDRQGDTWIDRPSR
jgi:hypothetical protein